MSALADPVEECVHVSAEEWQEMQQILSQSSVRSLLLIDDYNAKKRFIPSNEFKVDYKFNEICHTAPNDCINFEKWFLESLPCDTVHFAFHCCTTKEIIEKLLPKNNNLTRIHFHSFFLDFNDFKSIVNYCPKLQLINVENSSTLDEQSAEILDQLPDLKHIILSSSDVYEEAVKMLLQKCPNLESINISNNGEVEGHCFDSINGNTIRRINIRDCWQLTYEQILLIANLKSNSLVEFLANSGINDESLSALCENTPNLVHLNISFDGFTQTDEFGRKALSSKGFKSIGKLKQLRILVIKHVGILKDSALKEIFKGCPDLRELTLNLRVRHALTDLAFQDIDKYCKKLKRIESVHIDFIGSISMQSMSCLQQLKRLVLRNNAQSRVNDEITQVIDNCNNLLVVNLDGCRDVGIDVYKACIRRANIDSNRLFFASLILTGVKEESVDIKDLPKNLRIRVNGPENPKTKGIFYDFDGEDLVPHPMDKCFYPDFYLDFN